MIKSVESFCVVALAGLAVATPAMAQEKITLKFAHQFPANNYLWVEGGQVFADAVTQATGGKVQFQVFPGAQLGKDNLTLMSSGLADMVALVPSYTPEKLAMSSVAELPGLFSSACEGTKKAWKIAQPGGLLDQAEYAPQGFRAVFVVTAPPYKIFTKNKPVEKLEDLVSLRIRAGGGGLDTTLRTLGGVPVKLPATELYDSIARGTLDGAMFPYLALSLFDLDTSFKHGIEGVPLGTASIIYAMREKSWQKLGPEAQKAVTEAGAKAQEHLCAWKDNEDTTVRARMVENGFQAKKLTPEEQARWNERLTLVGDAWVKQIAKSGSDGQPLLDAMRASAE